MELHKLTLTSIKQLLQKKEISAHELSQQYINRITNYDSKLKVFVGFEPEKILKQAKASDERRAKGNQFSDFDGIPISIKDNICIQGEITACGSKFLSNYHSPFSATVVERLQSKGFVLIPRANMDEFAMGSSTENSAFQVTRNPFDTQRIPGGSSGGSASAVAGSFSPVSLGSDTGGSIRQPAALTGIYGLKPTYGRVSRYGLVAYASSLDQIGPFSGDVEGMEEIFSLISGFDPKDSTTAKLDPYRRKEASALPLKGLKLGIMKDDGANWEESVRKKFFHAVDVLKSAGATISELDFSLFDYSIPVYYILATAECSSNLSRFDGIRFGNRAPGDKLEDVYVNSRSEGFGEEVKRRILLGTYSLSSGFYSALYGQAQKIQVLFQRKYKEHFSNVDLILQPTSPTVAFQLGERTTDPIQMYKADVLTTSVNLSGIPGVSAPLGTDAKGLPIGLQVSAPHFAEERIFRFLQSFQEFSEFKISLPDKIQ